LSRDQRRCAGETQEFVGSGEESMMVLFGYFLIAAATGMAASAVIGYFLVNLIERRFLKTEVERNGLPRYISADVLRLTVNKLNRPK
jgi:hypothetical protein